MQTLRLPKLFPASLGDKLISYGSCQFPTMGFVVERFKSIQGFHSEPFWKIKVTHEERGCKVESRDATDTATSLVWMCDPCLPG